MADDQTPPADVVPDSPPARSPRRRILLLLALAALLAVGGLVWYVAFRDDSDPALRLAERAGTGQVVDPTTLAGPWRVVPGTDPDRTVAGYRVREEFAAGARKKTASGRTEEVTGGLTVAGRQISRAAFTVDVRTLTSDEARRDAQITSRGLETARYPKARFELTQPIDLPTIADGKVFTAPAVGRLTLHGTTKTVTLRLSARVTGSAATIQGAVPVYLPDYGIDSPGISGFVTVSDRATFEFLISLEPDR